MQWRLQAKGYTTGQAWWRETAWVYGVASVGFGLYAVIAVFLRFLGVPLEIKWIVLHCLAWGFFVLAHLPDIAASEDTETLPGDVAMQGGVRGWNLLFAMAIAAVNITAALLSPELLVLAEFRFASISPALVNLALQVALILFATAVHGVFNGVISLGYRLVFIRHTAPSHGSPARVSISPEPAVSPVETEPSEPLLHALRAEPSDRSAQPTVASPKTSATLHAAGPRTLPIHIRPPHPGSTSPSPPEAADIEDLEDSDTERPTSFRWFARRRATEAIRPVVDYLGTVPPEELRPTFRVLSAMAIGDAGRLGTPALLDAYKDHLFHPDGSINAIALCHSLRALPEVRSFYPETELGRTVYRPIVRRLHRALHSVEVPTLRLWLAIQPPAVQRCAALIRSTPPEAPVIVACLCSRNIHRSRTMQKTLDHLIRRNALGHVVWTCSGGVDLDPDDPWDLNDPALNRVLRKQNVSLGRAGILEHDWRPQSLSDHLLLSAAVVLVADTDVERKVRERLQILAPDRALEPDRILLFPTLDPRRFNDVRDLPDPYRGQTSVRESARSILAVMVDRVLPILLARATALAPPGPYRRRSMPLPLSPTERMGVATYKNALVNLEGRLRRPKSPSSPERLLKLIWATAHRDPTMLLLHGLPDALLEHARECTELDGAILWNSLRNLRFLDAVVPKNRTEDYGRLAKALRRVAAGIPAAKLR